MQVHLLSFEGPDPYARAGGIASRVTGLADALAGHGFETHLWFVGAADAPGHERIGQLHLHRWCQWISRFHPAGVYDGEDGKAADYAQSLPPYMMAHHLGPHLAAGGRAVVLAEEWQTAAAVLHLDRLLADAGLRAQVPILWNANNTFGFERIDWRQLERASVITTVSRYMKHRMQAVGVDPLVFPNGLAPDAFDEIDPEAAADFQRVFAGRTVLAKVARFDPDKRWLQAIDIVGELKRRGWRPLLVARGGVEAHGGEVLARAASCGLRVVERVADAPGEEGFLRAMQDTDDADIVHLRSHVDADSRRLLFGEAAAVLANSSHEPFGLVGLETMAVRGVACTGYSGEDYAVPGRNAIVLQHGGAEEFVELFQRLREDPDEEREVRDEAARTAREYAWPEVVRRTLLPRIELLRARGR